MKTIKTNIALFKTFINDNQRKSFPTILWEVFVLTFIKKGFPFYYFGRFVYRKESGNFKDYISTKEYYNIIESKKLNCKTYNSILGNKLIFQLFCEKNNLPIPKMLSYNFNKTFYFQGESFEIYNKIQLLDYFLNVFKVLKKESLFLKPFNGKAGNGIYLLNYNELENQINSFGEILLNNFYIHQEVIEQHSEINKIYSKSINTLRIMTYIDNSGNTQFLETFMRFGVGNNVVDNMGGGGFYVPINMDQGVLYKEGYQDLKYGGRILNKRHPDTNYQFSGFKIPFFHVAHNLCLNLTKLVPNKLSGWDIAITPNGPLIVEGNSNPGILTGETHYKGFLKHPVYKKIILES